VKAAGSFIWVVWLRGREFIEGEAFGKSVSTGIHTELA
jgi:hypothetical protein